MLTINKLSYTGQMATQKIYETLHAFLHYIPTYFEMFCEGCEAFNEILLSMTKIMIKIVCCF